MSGLIWTPGMAGPLDEFVKRVNRMVEAFADEYSLEQAEVRVELADGRRLVLASLSPEPGFGFFSLVPHTPGGDPPRRVVVPVGMVKSFEIAPPDPEEPFGFAYALGP